MTENESKPNDKKYEDAFKNMTNLGLIHLTGYRIELLIYQL